MPSAEQRAGDSIEGRDSVNLYLGEIARTPLLDAATEVELSKTIEAGLFAEKVLEVRNADDPAKYLNILEVNTVLAQTKKSGQKGRSETEAKAYAAELVESLAQFAHDEEQFPSDHLDWLTDEGKRASQHFIQANLRLVVSIARKYGRSAMPMLDLVQEGNTGLIRAVEKFDYEKGFKFSTYATWWIRQAVTRGIAQQARVVRLPVHVVEELNQLGSARRNLERELGREPEPHEYAAELGISIERVLDLLAWGRDHVSLDTPVDEDGDTSLADLVAKETTPGPEEGILDDESRRRLDDLVELLDARSADVVRARYGLYDGRQEKLADIGKRHGVSAERVRQLEREALAMLRKLADPDLE